MDGVKFGIEEFDAMAVCERGLRECMDHISMVGNDLNSIANNMPDNLIFQEYRRRSMYILDTLCRVREDMAHLVSHLGAQMQEYLDLAGKVSGEFSTGADSGCGGGPGKAGGNP